MGSTNEDNDLEAEVIEKFVDIINMGIEDTGIENIYHISRIISNWSILWTFDHIEIKNHN
jgi:hypothetical protein